jgi:hypothetical protein
MRDGERQGEERDREREEGERKGVPKAAPCSLEVKATRVRSRCVWLPSCRQQALHFL